MKPLGIATLVLALAACGNQNADTTAQTPEPEATAPAPAPMEAPAPTPTEAAVPAPKLQAAMRDLWLGHIVAARDYALARHAGNDADARKAADAVVANAKQIAGAVGGFYGQSGGDRMM